jgi:hypothetical protein
MKQIFQDVQPGIVFESTYGSLNTEPGLFLKLRDQKAVNLATYSAFRWTDQQMEVEVVGTLSLSKESNLPNNLSQCAHPKG